MPLSLPEEFFDETGDQLLVQPAPQFLYARLHRSAFNASLEPGPIGTPGRAPIVGVGADYRDFRQDQLEIASDLPSQIFAVAHDFNGGPGTTLRVNRPSYETTTYSEASRKIARNTSISTVPIQISEEQNNLTLYTFGGPFDQTNSRVAPYALDAFTAQLGVHKASQIVGNQLRYDYNRTLDSIIAALLDTASVSVYPEGMTADDDATVAGSFPLTLEQVNRLEQLSDQANLPTFNDGYRLLVCTTLQVKQLKDDPQYQRAAEFHKEFNSLFQGNYIGSVGKTHVFKSTTLRTVNNSSSIGIARGHYISPGVMMAGMGRRPQVRTHTNDNYGEMALLIWLADLAFKMANNTFVYSVRSSA